MICLNSKGLPLLEELKNLRAVTMEDIRKEELLNNCIDNQKVFDENGKFIPYSTIVNTIEEHKILCEHYSDRQIKKEGNSKGSSDIIQELSGGRTNRLAELKETIGEHNPKALFADGHDDAIMGYSSDGRVIYSVDKIVGTLVERDGMTPDESIEYFNFNIECAYLGEYTPIYVYEE